MPEKNNGKIVCKNCQSVILLANAAELVTLENGIELPAMTANSTSDFYSSFWSVNDMFTFENVGFCNTVNNIKYLSCADCEIGPIGAHFIDQPIKIYYVAPERVQMSS